MIVFDQKIIFVHIPKTGGTSIGSILHPYLKINNTTHFYKEYIETQYKEHHAEHKTYREYELQVSQHNLNILNFFVFAFVRNPYSRLVSLWRYWSIRNQLSKQNFGRNLTFLPKNNKIFGFMKSGGSDPCEFEQFVYHLHSQKNNIHMLGNIQSSYITPDNASFIGSFENINSDWHKLLLLLSEHTNIDMTHMQIPHLNTTSQHTNEYLQYIRSNKTKEYIYDIYQKDFEIFQYQA